MKQCQSCHQVFPHREDCPLVECQHGVRFDHEQALSERLSTQEIRARWPRLNGECPEGCGYEGVYYATMDHWVWGKWGGDIPFEFEVGVVSSD